jgi:hypothetical protein
MPGDYVTFGQVQSDLYLAPGASATFKITWDNVLDRHRYCDLGIVPIQGGGVGFGANTFAISITEKKIETNFSGSLPVPAGGAWIAIIATCRNESGASGVLFRPTVVVAPSV